MESQRDIHDLYMELIAKSMCSAGTLRQNMKTVNGWQCEFQWFEGCNLDNAKACITEFLSQAWGAYNIEFYQKKGQGVGKFWARFISPILSGHIQTTTGL